MDQQTCRVALSSFAYTAEEVKYVWSGSVPVSVSELAINDYMFVSQTVGRSNITTKLGNHSSHHD